MKLEYTPVTAHIRMYKDENASYDSRAPYDGILTIQYLTKEIAYIFGAHAPGCFTAKTLQLVHDLLKAKGVKQLIYERDGKMITREL